MNKEERERAGKIVNGLKNSIEVKDYGLFLIQIHLLTSKQLKHIEELEKEVKELREIISKIPDLLHDSLGNRENEYIIKDLPENSCVDDGEFWITHREVGSGEPLKQWIKSEIDKSLTKNK